MKIKYNKVPSTDFYQQSNYESLLKRIHELKVDSPKQWGKMNPSQMLHHLNLAIGSGLGFYTLEDVSSIMSRNIVKPVLLNVLKRMPIDARTPRTLVVKDDLDFETEKKQLLEILEEAFKTQTDKDWHPHTLLGKMTRKQWGKLIMIHVNHHLVQFGL